MKRRRQESGFAMLMVFLMAACIAITLYMEIPRVAFEAERQRELLLVDRGNQFKRAIQVFTKDKTNNPTGRYPASIEELESFNNHRYLRHKYVDPMTGKDEWRLIHINGGVLTDSVTTQAKPGTQNAQSGTGSTYLSQTAFMDIQGDNGGANGGVNRALNRRPSDGGGAPVDPNNPGAPGLGNGSGASAGALPPAGGPGGPGGPPMPGMPPGTSGLPATAPGTPTDPSQQSPQQSPQQQAGGSLPGMPGGAPNFPGIPGAAQNGQSSAQSQAASMIGNLLTQPRPGGMPTGMPGSTTLGGGIAGVASKYEAEGIMVINQRTKINEWEYIFDASKWRAPPNPVTGAVGTPLQPMNPGLNGTPIGQPAGNTPTGPVGPTGPTGPGGGGGTGQ